MSRMTVGLLVVIGFSCISTEAQPNQPLPQYDPSFSTVCDTFTPEASFQETLGSGYVAQSDWAHSRCLTQYNEKINSRAYTITYYYDNNGRLESYPPVIQIVNPLNLGQVQTVTPYPNGTYQAVESSVIAGYVGGSQIVIVVRDIPPQEEVMAVLKQQLAAIGLHGIKLNVITHNCSCIYFKLNPYENVYA